MTTQWDRDMNGLAGLNYSRLRFVAQMFSIRLTRTRFEDIRTMEGAVLKLAAELREQAKG